MEEPWNWWNNRDGTPGIAGPVNHAQHLGMWKDRSKLIMEEEEEEEEIKDCLDRRLGYISKICILMILRKKWEGWQGGEWLEKLKLDMIMVGSFFPLVFNQKKKKTKLKTKNFQNKKFEPHWLSQKTEPIEPNQISLVRFFWF